MKDSMTNILVFCKVALCIMETPVVTNTIIMIINCMYFRLVIILQSVKEIYYASIHSLSIRSVYCLSIVPILTSGAASVL